MQLTTVLALVCFSHSVLCAPAVTQKQVVKDKETQKLIPSDTLELQLQGMPFNPPIQTLHENEAGNEPVIEELGSNNNGGPEVKRSERVDLDDVRDSLDDLSGNMQAADQDVKAVLRTFFQNLKQHPEIVEDIIEREGAKLMDRPLEKEGEEEEREGQEGDVAADVVPLDVSDFQQPSPQLIESPKQVEKKTGAFPEYPRFIYKSPMRNMKERNQLTERSQNNEDHPSEPSDSNEVAAHDVVVNDGSDIKAPSLDLSNAIPVIQQPSTKQETDAEQVNELLSNPEEGGEIDLASLEQAQDEYSKSHPFMNTLPIFPDHIKGNDHSEDLVKPEHETQEQHQDIKEKSKEQAEKAAAQPSVRDTEIVNTDTDAGDTVERHKQEAEPEEKRSGDSVETNEEKHVDESEGRWSETQVGEKSKEIVPHQLTGSEIAAELLNNPVKSESSVTFRPYYYYYYNEDGEKADEGELDAAEKGGESEDNNENELKKISSEGESSEEGEEEEEEEDENEHEADEGMDEDEDEHGADEGMEEDEATGEEETEEEDEEDEADDNDDPADDSKVDEGVVEDVDEDEESERENEEIDAEESESEINDTHDDSEETGKADDKTNSKKVHVDETVIISDPNKPGTPRLFKSKGLMVDKNEADLLSLPGDGQRQPAHQPIAGQPM